MTSRIALTLDNQPVEIERGVFPDGAVWLKVIGELPRFAQVMRVRVAAMRDMNDFMLLAQLVDAVRHVTDIAVSHLELAWLPWARQDRHMVNGDSFALKVFANQLNTLNFNKVFLLDPHSDAAAAAINNSVVIAQETCLMKSENLLQAINTGKLMLVAPDAGALKKIHNVAKASGARDYAILTKERDVATGNLTGFSLVSGNVAGKDVLIVDDLCDAGGTFIGSAQVLRDAGARSVSLYVTHGVFSKGVENLLNNGIDAIYTTTSFASSELRDPRVELIDIDTIFCA
ncbi:MULTISPECIES: ribose-phosphate diphosphokinase [Phytobacter]|uniref:Ribose-phosphate pyrophosphokinase n=1 Tax=Phytobacter diazotrophicus TaxID=395631 RepID=A0ABM7VPL4_9ENTR|nr:MULTISPECIES: ribose-phosphate diphosphokinase [Phytobacter]MDU4152781.1 ribose-phosphate diphosphokinase [Enterobacteriaceae bacterium]MDU7380428.1 ribose-phosphate diphosphokinase [Enterobacteriaceae bacterium]BBE75378.1 ribose-phosphate pyrophosphokinase [Phytobacter sp. MRY16-398]BDD48947.1 ribose-phosphate pyrophosphokinase [Phytobacter diazotrophicus]BEG79979.1 phosphoribosyltransferase family protein [Phytobacter diazotrophicus]